MTTPDVPAGRYAISTDGTWNFYKVDRPTEGTYAGRTFVRRQAGDDLIRIYSADRFDVLRAIAVDPKTASVMYGKQLGACGVCGRTLTDPDSIRNGIGPVCSGKMHESHGW
jgi:hypothetical protein